VKQEQFWRTQVLEIECADSIASDQPLKKVNLPETFVEALVYPQRNKSLVRHWLPAEFCINTIEFRRDHVVPFFPDRQTSVVLLWESRGGKPKGTLYTSVVPEEKSINLPRERRNQKRTRRSRAQEKSRNPKDSSLKKKKKTPHRVDTTTKPLKGEERCPFFFDGVYWDKVQQRWWVPEKQNGNPNENHVGHLQVTPNIVPARASNLPVGDRILACNMIKGNFGLSAMHMLLLKWNGISLSMKKLEYLWSKEREVLDNPNLSRSFGDKPMVNHKTPTNKLLEQFGSDENSSYVALFAEMTSDQLTIKKKRKHKNIHSIAELTEKELKSVQDSRDSAKLHAKKLEKV
jgi:hypothetical protein